jgi:transposase InsO family protein
VWSYNFVVARTDDSGALQILSIMDEFDRKCLATLVARRLPAEDVLNQLYILLLLRGIPGYMHTDNGPEFAERAVRKRI